MAETEPKRTAKKAAAEKGRWGRTKDVHNTESQAGYYARKYMESRLLIIIRGCNPRLMKLLVG